MVIVSGGTGLIGKALLDEIKDKKVIVVSRNKLKASQEIRRKDVTVLEWGDIFEEKWIEKLRAENERTILNLSGENIGKPWTKAVKRKLMESRVNTTRDLVALAEKIRAQKFISASAIGFYGDTGDEERDESSPPGDLFLSRLCQAWESEAKKAESNEIYILRMGVVLAKKAKIIRYTLTPFFVLNAFGKGQNYISWIHIKDLTRIIKDILDDKFGSNGKYIEGERKKPKGIKKKTTIINCVSPNPVRASEFIKTIATISDKKVINIPQILFTLIFGKDFVRETINISQRIVPSFLIENKFNFSFPDIRTALEDLIR